MWKKKHIISDQIGIESGIGNSRNNLENFVKKSTSSGICNSIFADNKQMNFSEMNYSFTCRNNGVSMENQK